MSNPLELGYSTVERLTRRDLSVLWTTAAALLVASLSPLCALSVSLYEFAVDPGYFAHYGVSNWLWAATGPLSLALAVVFEISRRSGSPLRRWSFAVAVYAVGVVGLCTWILWKGSFGQQGLDLVDQICNAGAELDGFARSVVLFAPILLLRVRDSTRWWRRAILLLIVCVLLRGLAFVASDCAVS